MTKTVTVNEDTLNDIFSAVDTDLKVIKDLMQDVTQEQVNELARKNGYGTKAYCLERTAPKLYFLADKLAETVQTLSDLERTVSNER